jgi:enterochelin esterase-like enzyme
VTAGTVVRIEVVGEALRGNLVGAEPRRRVDVYVPPGGAAGRPLLVDLVGFTGSGLTHAGFKPFGENVPARLDRLITGGAMPPVVVAFPDCFTRLGGNQYIDSVATGRWETFLVDELVPAVEARFGCGGAGRRGVFGKSSGGYGALVHAMRRADTWAAAAVHSADIGFDWCYRPQLPHCLRYLAQHGSVEAVVEAAHRTAGKDVGLLHALEVLAMAAHYDPDPSAPLGVRLPVDLETCELDVQRWARWLAWDPLTLVERHAEELRRLRGLFIDCGRRDQHNLVYGARRLHRRLDALGVPHRYEEFDDDHTAIDYRMDVSLPWLAATLEAA